MNKIKTCLIISLFFGFSVNVLSIELLFFEKQQPKYNKKATDDLEKIISAGLKTYGIPLPTKEQVSNGMKAVRTGANPNIYNNVLIFRAIELNNLEDVKELIEKYGVNVNAIPLLGQAIENSQFNIIKYLINNGADINHPYRIYYKLGLKFRHINTIPQNFETTPLEHIIIELSESKYPKAIEDEFIKLIRILLHKNAKFDENKILKYYPNYKKDINPVVLKLFEDIKELRAQKIEESTSCPMDLARIIEEYASEQLPASKEEKEDKEKGEES